MKLPTEAALLLRELEREQADVGAVQSKRSRPLSFHN